MRNLILIAIIMVLTGSCVTTQVQKLNPAVYYKNDICVRYDTKEKIKVKEPDESDNIWEEAGATYTYKKKIMRFCGTGVLPFKDKYDLEITSYGKLNFFTMTTCHEEDTTENPDRGIFKKNGKINVMYQPTLEKGLACPLYIAAYSKRQRHAWGVIAFEHPRFQLQAIVRCNGVSTNANGVSLCQSRQGLIQEIEFSEEVKAADPVAGATDRKISCPKLESEDNKRFRFKLPNRECIYGFIGKKTLKAHKMYTIGYEDIIVRE